MAPPPRCYFSGCHVERSETSLIISARRDTRKVQRSVRFAQDDNFLPASPAGRRLQKQDCAHCFPAIKGTVHEQTRFPILLRSRSFSGSLFLCRVRNDRAIGNPAGEDRSVAENRSRTAWRLFYRPPVFQRIGLQILGIHSE